MNEKVITTIQLSWGQASSNNQEWPSDYFDENLQDEEEMAMKATKQ